MGLLQVDFQIAFLGNPHRVFHRLRQVFEKLNHLFGRAEGKVVVFQAQSVLVVNPARSLDGKKYFVGGFVVFQNIVDVLCGDEGNVQFF